MKQDFEIDVSAVLISFELEVETGKKVKLSKMWTAQGKLLFHCPTKFKVKCHIDD